VSFSAGSSVSYLMIGQRLTGGGRPRVLRLRLPHGKITDVPSAWMHVWGVTVAW
jgi:hypothetical protein